MSEVNKKQNKIVEYFKSSFDELKKVKWPTRQEAVKHSILVVLICIFMAMFLGLLDFGLTNLVEWMISLKK